MMKKMVLLVALCLATMVADYAQEPSKAEIKIKEIVKKYENVKGVECVTVTKGKGLGLVKMMLNSEMGKDFMKGVTCITIINYTDASQETCLALRKEVESFGAILEEFDMSKDKDLAENEYNRSYASISAETKSISDFVIAMEDAETKMMMHMAGKIKVDVEE